jgi:hypothetical protein
MNAHTAIDLTQSDDEEDDCGVIDLTFDDGGDDNDQSTHPEVVHSVATTRQKCQRRARSLVNSINTMVESLGTKQIRAIDNSIPAEEAFFQCRASFELAKKPTHVSVGYRFSFSQSSDGLFACSNSSITNGSVQFGDGVYTGTHPLAFPKRGPHGLLLAVLRGSERDIRSSYSMSSDQGVDTIVGNRTGNSPYEDEIVLRQERQVLPLVCFARGNIHADSQLSDLLWLVHQKIQVIVDKYFNDSKPTPLTRILPPKTRGPFGILSYVAPATLRAEKEICYRSIAAPNDPTKADECCFCLDLMVSNVVQMKVCTHCFHEDCLREYLEPKASDSHHVQPGEECPECRRSIKEPRGRSPSGTMQVSTKLRDCAGFPGCGSIAITYSIP